MELSRLAGPLLAAAALVIAPSAAQAAAPTPPTWTPCPATPDFQCASIKAPLDYDQPAGPQIDLALIRKPATDQAHRLGTLFTNSGGPGGASTDGLPLVYPLLPARLKARYDVLGVDPRGIGNSSQLRCFQTPEQEAALLGQLPPAGFPSNPTEDKLFTSVYAQFAQACRQRGGPIQYHMGTADVARDFDRVRSAVGDPKLNYYGPSYGTYLGATYANLFPQDVGKIVLDGDVPPVQWNDAVAGARDNTFTRIQSPLGAEVTLASFLAQCGLVPTDRCAFSAGGVRQTRQKYAELLRRLQAAPVTLDGVQYTRALVTATVASGLAVVRANAVLPAGWKELAQSIETVWEATGPAAPAQARQRQAARQMRVLRRPALADFALGLPEGTDGVLCGESPNPSDPASYTPQAQRANATQSPLGGFGDVWTGLARPCASWTQRDQDVYRGPFDKPTPPILLVGTLADPNTAFTGTLRDAQQLSNTRVLTVAGGGHTALLNKSTCADAAIDSYFVDGSLPRQGTVCAQDGSPF